MKSSPRILALLSAAALLGCGKNKVTAPLPVSGSEWRSTAGPPGGSVSAFVTGNGDLLAGTTSGVFRSTDGGANWEVIGLAGTSVTALVAKGSLLVAGVQHCSSGGACEGDLFRSTDHGATWTAADPWRATVLVTAFAIDGDVLLAATRDIGACDEFGCAADVLRSTDGETWTTVLTHTDANALMVIGTSVFAGVAGGVLRSIDHGDHWTLGAGMTGTAVTALTAVGTDLFAGTADGRVFLSTDNGDTWSNAGHGLTSTPITALAVRGTILFAGTSGSGLFRSSDHGVNWGNPGALGPSDIRSLAVHDRSLLVGTTGGGTYRSTDDGASWTTSRLVNSQAGVLAFHGASLIAAGAGVFRSTDNGDSWTTVGGLTDVTIDVFATGGSSLFAGTLHQGVLRSTDEGATWTALGPSGAQINALALRGADLYASSYGLGLLRSTDGGVNWTEINTGLGNSFITALAVGETTVFAAAGGVFRSTDSGDHWTPAGLSGVGIQTLAVSGTMLLAGTYDSGVYRSSDGGDTWTPAGLAGTSVDVLVVSGTKILAGTSDGVFVSNNAGGTWSDVSRGLADRHVPTLAVGRAHLFAGSSGNGVWRYALN